MISLRSLHLFILVGALGATACSKPEPKNAGDAEHAASKGMEGEAAPSTALPASVTFSAAQIEHGGVKWGAPTMGSASSSAVVPGEVSPNEDRTARLGAPTGGRIISVSVRPGDRVMSGQPLVTMQSPDAGVAQSDVSKADAELASRRAQAQYAASARARAERLLALKAIPRQDYERAITDDDQARAALAQAESELRRARGTAEQLSVGAASSGQILLRAPFAGVVLARTAVPGAVVEAGSPLVIITDPSSLWLAINAPEQLAGLFHRGGHLRFTVPAFPADTFAANVDAVGAGDQRRARKRADQVCDGEQRDPHGDQRRRNVTGAGRAGFE